MQNQWPNALLLYQRYTLRKTILMSGLREIDDHSDLSHFVQKRYNVSLNKNVYNAIFFALRSIFYHLCIERTKILFDSTQKI